ncbi:[protein-PII] uridylyltransferase [Denitratisoma oestradiolicum]|uniref:Bifunctional uridylyltransferase/uridylyl-removing enzyme n=1 Tax=Denitratisoma oestradiolicum TaxID=311182 RepID=A0A6S6YA73_9PROT|nr:[protein-PII] uridylyltransferase [Denitratisoma oestradiolicum]TWO79800.1 [protein-PII] uridylyltransferase [Denitratisoma oestradiolicum]CAB1369492.1 [Protein-PII] uridylyltransferase / [Protein-PII]-UMP uridylyl-removing enzyme [Denitratisoma oestradiolicum]
MTVQNGANQVQELRGRLRQEQDRLRERYEQDGNALALLKGRTRLVDSVLDELWQSLEMPLECTLVAVGGYGRGELYPCSDVDLLLLVTEDTSPARESRLELLVSMLWDIGLEVGHSVRSPSQCVEEAYNDITVQTTLLEGRYLTGNRKLFETMASQLVQTCRAEEFFKAKLLEQAERYAKYNDTPYSLEPNCKESPGGLRDLHVIFWVARAAALGPHWRDLCKNGVVTPEETRQLIRAEQFLRQLRIRLHFLARRGEERILFDHQESLAAALGIKATSTKRASEVLMQRYYRNAKLVTQLNTLVLQNIEAQLFPQEQDSAFVLDEDFQVDRGLLDMRDNDLFAQKPTALLRCFLVLEQHPELKGMTTRTLRALWMERKRIDAAYRRDPAHRALFLELFQQKHLIHELRRMNQYDILGQYLPAFGHIVGQMQHDLFHIYTVDQHILQVVRNLRRFAMPDFAHEYPLCSRLMADFDRHWLLYVAALFHDIAKGRGGDHSRKGMVDARRFCQDHGIDADDIELVVFLVGNHLTMSAVAQKQDLSDPDVVTNFTTIVKTERRLAALYLLTVADIRGTSPKVWNVWKGKLLEDLFRMTLQHLRGNAVLPLAGSAARQDEVRQILRYHGLRPDIEAPFWRHLDGVYFLRHDAEEIAWHTRTLYYRAESPDPVVRARLNPFGEGLQVMAYCQDQPELFARLCGYFSRLGYSIVDAKIHTTRHGYALDSFVLLDAKEHLPYRDMVALIEHDLVEQLKTCPPLAPPTRGRLSRQVRHFPFEPKVEVRADERGNRFIISITAADRPGLLYGIARILGRHGVNLETAKIATLGELVEDTFLVSGPELGHTSTLVRIEQELLEALQT